MAPPREGSVARSLPGVGSVARAPPGVGSVARGLPGGLCTPDWPQEELEEGQEQGRLPWMLLPPKLGDAESEWIEK